MELRERIEILESDPRAIERKRRKRLLKEMNEAYKESSSEPSVPPPAKLFPCPSL